MNEELSLLEKLQMYYSGADEKIKHHWIITALKEAKLRNLTPEMHEYVEMEIMQIMQENDEIIQKENAENMELVKLFKHLHSQSAQPQQHR